MLYINKGKIYARNQARLGQNLAIRWNYKINQYNFNTLSNSKEETLDQLVQHPDHFERWKELQATITIVDNL